MMRRLAPWCVVLIHAGCGLFVALAWFPIGDLAVESDFFAELGPAAQAIARGEISLLNHPYKGPMHGLVLAGLHGVLQPLGIGWYRAALVLSLLSAAGALLLVGSMVRQLAGARAGFAAMILTGGVYEVFVQSHKASSDPLFLLLCVAVVAVVFTPDRAGPRRWLLAGLLAGAAFLTRYIGAVLLVWLVLQALTSGGVWKVRARRGLPAMVGWILLAGPWMGLSLSQTGSLLENRNIESIARAFEPVLGSEAASQVSTVGDIIAGDPAGVIGHYLLRLPQTLYHDAVRLAGLPIALAALLGLLALVVRSRDRRAWRWILFGGLYLAALSWVFYLPRFALPQAPIYAMLVGLALFLTPGAPAWDRRLAAFWAWRGFLPAWMLVAGLFIYQVYHCQLAVRFYRMDQPLHLQGAIAHLTDVAAGWPEGTRPVLLARTAHAAFHAGCDYGHYPRRDLGAAEFLKMARDRGADLVLVGPVERRLAGNLRFLDDLSDYGGVRRSFNDGTNAVLALDAAAHDFGRDLLAAAMADSIPVLLERGRLLPALDTGYDLMQRHLRARRVDEARILVADLLAYLESDPDHDPRIARRMRGDLEKLIPVHEEPRP